MSICTCLLWHKAFKIAFYKLNPLNFWNKQLQLANKSSLVCQSWGISAMQSLTFNLI